VNSREKEAIMATPTERDNVAVFFNQQGSPSGIGLSVPRHRWPLIEEVRRWVEQGLVCIDAGPDGKDQDHIVQTPNPCEHSFTRERGWGIECQVCGFEWRQDIPGEGPYLVTHGWEDTPVFQGANWCPYGDTR
jgi:hypothetical protein